MVELYRVFQEEVYNFRSLHKCIQGTYTAQVMEGRGVIPSTQRYYRRVFTIYYYYLNCYMFPSYDHLQIEIYLLGFTRLTTDPLFLEYS
jgi:hypothetical protein